MARLTSRNPWKTVIAWVVILVLGVYSALSLGDNLTNDVKTLSNPESQQGSDLVTERFGADPLDETIVITSETQPDLEVVGEAADGHEGVRLAAEHVPDIVLMDLLMPGMDGIEATQRIRTASTRTRVVALTSFHEDASIFPAIRAGALSYLLKDIAPEEVAAAVRRAARGETVVHPRVAARLMESVRGDPEHSLNPYVDPTEREQEGLRLIAQGMSNAVIAESLSIGEKTVKGHVSNVLGKLYLQDRTQAAVYAWREGFVRRDPSS